MKIYIRRSIIILAVIFLSIPLLIASANSTTLVIKGKQKSKINGSLISKNNKYIYKSDEVIVKYKKKLSLVQEEKIKRLANIKETKKDFGFAKQNIQLVKLKSGAIVKKSIAKLEKQDAVEYAELNYGGQGAYLPNDTDFKKQWGLNNSGQVINGNTGKIDADIDMPEAWDYIGSLSKTAVVAVIDSGIDLNHPDLKSKIWVNGAEIPGDNIDNDHNGYIDDVNGYDWVEGDSIPDDDLGHGTHVSGIIAAAVGNKRGVAGIAGYPENAVKIMPLKVLNSQNWGLYSDWISAIYYAVEKKVDIINMSLIGYSGYSQALQDAINYANSKGIVVIACSGNDGDSTIRYPAGMDNVIGVGSTTNTDTKASFSNYNSSVDLSAPGWYIYSTTPTYPNYSSSINYDLNYDYYTGTSMSNAAVSGLAALIKAKWPSYSPAQVQQVLQENADDLGAAGRDDYFGYGRINAVRIFDTSPPVNLTVSSSSHPYQTHYYRNNDPRFSFNAVDPSDIGGYSYELNRLSSYNVDLLSEGTANSKAYSEKANGTWYFHIRVSDVKGNWSGVKTRRINIDNYRPRTRAPRRVRVRRRRTAKLYWRVYDPYTGGKAYVIIKLQKKVSSRTIRRKKIRYLKYYKRYKAMYIKTKKRKYKKAMQKYLKAYRNVNYRTVKTIRYGWTRINKTRYCRQRFRNKGVYRFLIYAKDRAGNWQHNIARNSLKVY